MVGEAADEITIAELAVEGWQSLTMFCATCSRQSYIRLSKLPGDPRAATIGDFRAKLRCKNCGNPPADGVQPWKPAPAATNTGPLELTRIPIEEA